MKFRQLQILIICLVAVFSSYQSHAAAHAWTGWYPISQVYLHQTSGAVYLSLNPGSAHSNPAKCKSASWIRLPANDWTKEVMKMALTAQASGMKVNAYISGVNCEGSYPQLLYFRTLSK